MLHPSYSDLIQVANSEVEPGENKVVNIRYSIVMAIAKRARQIIDGDEPMVYTSIDKPLTIAVEEMNKGKMKIIGDEEPITCRPADLIKPELETLKQKCAQWIEQDEDVLSYALFDQVATKYFEFRQAGKYKIDADLADRENMTHPV
jgi:DNA-directed RNA polymerase omega subunit